MADTPSNAPDAGNPLEQDPTAQLPSDVAEARQRFIEGWGHYGPTWGVNRTMAQIHALLLLAPEPLDAEQIMAALNISRGNANMNLRALVDWGLVGKQLKLGERREYFVAEKDIWQVTKRIAQERRKRELQPMLELLNSIKNVGENSAEPHAKTLHQSVTRIRRFSGAADKVIETVLRADETWFFKIFMKLFR